MIEKYISIRTNITERHQSAERLRQSEATFSASFQAAASAMGFLSPKGQWLRANPALCEFLGYSEDELHEMTLAHVFPRFSRVTNSTALTLSASA